MLALVSMASAANESSTLPLASMMRPANEIQSPQFFDPQSSFALQTTFTLTVNTIGAGTVAANPPGPSYAANTQVVLTATPNAGNNFLTWTGDFGSNDPTKPVITITMNANKSLTAVFVASGPPPPVVQYRLNIAIVPQTSAGRVDRVPSKDAYNQDEQVRLTAVANPGWQFKQWSGDATGTSNPVTVTMATTRSVAAEFQQLCYTLTVNKNPANVGTFSQNPAPNCNNGTQYLSGTAVVLTANQAPGYTFSNWSGCDAASGVTCNVTMNAAKSVTANYAPVTSSSTASSSSTVSSSATSSSATSSATSSSATSSSVASSSAASSSTTSSSAASSVQVLATITPLLSGVATVTPTPRPTSALPSTGLPLTWLIVGVVLVLIVVGARYLRQNSVP
jgi:hypothetical protein